MLKDFRAVALLIFGLVTAVSISLMSSVSASTSSFSASGFSQYCSQNSSTCNKVNFNDQRTGTVSCPSQNQVINQVYVHAGGGQTVYELPDNKFSFSYSNNQNTVTVNALQGTADISWIGVTCTNTQPSPSPSANPSVNPSPSVAPSPSPSAQGGPSAAPSASPSPSSSPCNGICIDCDGGGTCEVTTKSPSPSPVVSVSPSPSADASPSSNPSPSSNTTTTGSGGPSGGSSSSSPAAPQGSVLGAKTLAPTGSFTESIRQLMLILGATLLGASAVSKNAQKKNSKKAKKSSPKKLFSFSPKFLLVTGILLILLSLSLGYYQNKVLSFNSYETPAIVTQGTKPTFLKIPSQSINLPISEAQIKDNTWEISDTGASHLNVSKNPAEKGNMIIYGHNKQNLLGKITNLKIGDQITILDEKTQIHNYIVEKTLIVKPSDIWVLKDTNEEELTLYTCTGLFDSQRFIVKALPI